MAAITPVMQQIDTVVFLMMENRSLDNMLGWLYNGSQPTTVYPPGSNAKFNGIPAGASNSYHKTAYSPEQGTAGYNQPARIPAFDPNEPMDHVKKQLYADAYGNMPSGNFWEQTPPMTGFAWDYHAWYMKQPGQVMGAYDSTQLPVMYGLAENFAVSDRWFCSVPTQTDPNRAFSVCGTSLGAEQNSDIDKNTFANANTIFNELGNAGKTWGMYWQSDNPAGTGEPLSSWAPFTSYYFSQMNNAPNGGVHKYSEFLSALDAGTLPNFCFLEPWWGGGKGVFFDPDTFVGLQGNDYHPPAWIGPAEYYLNGLYEALVASKQWPNMLFILTFDEHGGTYDHEPPTKCLAPDSHVGKSGFQFERLGVRVPMILASPYVDKSVVFRAPTTSQYDFDHTSFVATMLKWAGVDPASANLGARVAAAPTFEDAVMDSPRTDPVPSGFTMPSDYKDQGGGTGHLNVGPLSQDDDAEATASLVQKHKDPLDWHKFRHVLDNTVDPKEFVQQLNELSGGE